MKKSFLIASGGDKGILKGNCLGKVPFLKLLHPTGFKMACRGIREGVMLKSFPDTDAGRRDAPPGKREPMR